MTIPLKSRSKSVKNERSQRLDCSQSSKPLESIQEESMQLVNTHREFDLEKYQQLAVLFRNMVVSYGENEVEFLKNVQTYLQLIQSASINEASLLKMVPHKREVIKQCFLCERQAIVAITLAIASKKQQHSKNYCKNLVSYIFENYLVVLNLLTHENSTFVLKFIKEEREHLLGKGFDFLRNNREIVTDLINKVVKVDPLFALEYYKTL